MRTILLDLALAVLLATLAMVCGVLLGSTISAGQHGSGLGDKDPATASSTAPSTAGAVPPSFGHRMGTGQWIDAFDGVGLDKHRSRT